jgi:thiamine-phosphate pyrophosphorylase
MRLFDPRLYLVVGAADCGVRQLGELLSAAVEGGVTLVQLREKNLGEADFIRQAREVRALLRPAGIPLVVNDSLPVALAAEADGLHVGQADLAPAEARAHLGPDAILGVSVGNLEELAATDLTGVDYIGCGPVFATATKGDAGEAIGPEGLAAVAARVRIPVIGIGGITAEGVERLMGSGAAGVAVVSAIAGAADPKAAARALRKAVALHL